MINIVGKQIQSMVVRDVLNSETGFYTIIADELTDLISNKEVLSLSVRFVDKDMVLHVHVREEFLEFVSVERTTGQDIADEIEKSLRDHGLPLDNIRGQAYDGASAMSSPKNGVQAIIRQKASNMALYTHCYSHCLNLAVASSANVMLVKKGGYYSYKPL